MHTKIRIHITIYILVLTCATLYLPNLFAQETVTFFGLPEGARAQLGKGLINDAKYSVDGRQLAVATTNGIWIYDAITHQPQHLLRDTDSHVNQIVFSPDGEKLAGLDRSGNVNVWNNKTGEHQYKLQQPQNVVHARINVDQGQFNVIGITTDAKTIVTVNSTGQIKHWSLETGKELHKIDLDVKVVKIEDIRIDMSCLAISPVDMLLATTTHDDKMILWDLITGEHSHILERDRDRGGLVRMVFSPDGATLACVGFFGATSLWNTKTWKKMHIFGITFSESYSFAFSPESSLFALNQHFNSIGIYQTNTAKQQQRLNGHSDTIQTISFSPDMRSIASGSRDGTLRVWDVATGKNRHTEKEYFGDFSCFAFSPDDKSIVSPGGKGYMCLWDTATGKLLKTFKKGRQSSVSDVAFSPDGRTIVTASRLGTIRLWDRSKIRRPKTVEVHEKGVSCVAFSPDEKTLAIGCADGTLLLWDVNTHHRKKGLKGHNDRLNKLIEDIVYSPDGKTLATVGYHDETIRLWDAETGERKPDIKEKIKNIICVAYSPDGKTLAVADQRGNIHLLDTSTYTLKNIFPQEQLFISCMTYGADGKTLAVGYFGGMVNILDTTTGKVLQTFSANSSSVRQVAFTSDGKTLASLSSKGELLLWEIE